MSPSGTILIGLFLYIRQVEPAVQCQVQQPLVVVAVVMEPTTLRCEYQCESNNKSVPLLDGPLFMQLSRDEPDNLLSTSHISIAPKGEVKWELPTRGDNDSGLYVCRGSAHSQPFSGHGTLLILHLGEKPADNTRTFVILAICCMLAAYSVCLTTAVCIRRKVCSRCKSYLAKAHSEKTRKPSATEQEQSAAKRPPGEQAAAAPGSENAYMALQRLQESVYNTLHGKERPAAAGKAASKAAKRTEAEQTEAQGEGEATECVYETF